MRAFLAVMASAVAVGGCMAKNGTADVVQTSPTTYSVSAEYGSLTGSWDRARNDAAARATQFCEAKGEQVTLLNEQRSGVLGFTPQQSTITFACAQNTKEAQQLASGSNFALNPWIGRSIADYVVQRGPPTTSIDLGGNKRAFQWRMTRQTPGAVIPLGNSSVTVPSGQESCMVSLVASSSKAAPTLSDWIIELALERKLLIKPASAADRGRFIFSI